MPVSNSQSSAVPSAVEVVKPSVPVSVAAPKAPAQPTPEVKGDSVKERILALMVEKTGYPKDMLDLDLDLEADLGVDTVKQAEMFAAIREIYNIPRDENRKLRDYPTLAHVIRFVYEKRPDLAGGTPPPPKAAEIPAAAPSSGRDPANPSGTGAGDDSARRRWRFRQGTDSRADGGEDRLSERHAGSGS